MDPGLNTHPASLSRRSLRPVLSQAYIARLFVEANDNLWWRPHDGSAECWSYGDPADHYWAYDPERKHWHKCRETGGYIHGSYGAWQCDTHGVPYYDFRPAIFFDLMHILNPLLETASAADQRRCGSYAFLNNTIKYLEHHERIVMEPMDLRREPRPCAEAREEEERADPNVPTMAEQWRVILAHLAKLRDAANDAPNRQDHRRRAKHGPSPVVQQYARAEMRRRTTQHKG